MLCVISNTLKKREPDSMFRISDIATADLWRTDCTTLRREDFHIRKPGISSADHPRLA
jgi:hypothetical protein